MRVATVRMISGLVAVVISTLTAAASADDTVDRPSSFETWFKSAEYGFMVGVAFTRTQLSYRPNADFEGLDLEDVSLSHGYQLNTSNELKVGVGVSASASLGAIRTFSVRDNAWHIAAGVEVAAFVRFYDFCIEASVFAREADSSNLDEVSVDPSYRGTMVSIVKGCRVR